MEDYLQVVYAAAHLAKELHQGQKDKGGNDYFQFHLMTVARSGSDWKEKVVGFLHDAAEDTAYDVPMIIRLLKEKLNHWLSCPEDSSWKNDFVEILGPCPKKFHFPTDDDWAEIVMALELLNHHTASSREEYISRMKICRLAVNVKLNDLRNNMDISRIPCPTEKDFARLERYKKEYKELQNQ